MSWIAITEALVTSKLSGPETAALKSAALATAQTDPLAEVIEQVVGEVRGYVGACSRNTLGDGDTIPSELLGCAISRIRFELCTRLPGGASLLGEDRRKANDNAITLLRDVASCSFAIVQPTTASTDQVSAPSPRYSGRDRQFTRTQQDGI